jgi:hypothetical protein
LASLAGARVNSSSVWSTKTTSPISGRRCRSCWKALAIAEGSVEIHAASASSFVPTIGARTPAIAVMGARPGTN